MSKAGSIISAFFDGVAKVFSASGWLAKAAALLFLISGLALLDHWFGMIGIDFQGWWNEAKSFFSNINFW